METLAAGVLLFIGVSFGLVLLALAFIIVGEALR